MAILMSCLNWKWITWSIVIITWRLGQGTPQKNNAAFDTFFSKQSFNWNKRELLIKSSRKRNKNVINAAIKMKRVPEPGRSVDYKKFCMKKCTLGHNNNINAFLSLEWRRDEMYLSQSSQGPKEKCSEKAHFEYIFWRFSSFFYLFIFIDMY